VFSQKTAVGHFGQQRSIARQRTSFLSGLGGCFFLVWWENVSTEQNRDLPQKGDYISQFFRDKPIFRLRTIFLREHFLGEIASLALWPLANGWMNLYQLGVG